MESYSQNNLIKEVGVVKIDNTMLIGLKNSLEGLRDSGVIVGILSRVGLGDQVIAT